MENNGREEPSKPNWHQHIRENWPWAAPGIYVYISVIGMIDAWKRFDAFGIRVFEFSDITDFLLAAFREPAAFLALGACIVAALVYALFFQFYVKWLRGMLDSESRPKTSAPFDVRIRLTYAIAIIVVVGPFVATFGFNDMYGDDWKRRIMSDSDRQVAVSFKQLERSTGTYMEHRQLIFIGSTSEYLFFVHEHEESFVIAPIYNIIRMRRVKAQ